ncbi:hypothetical protein [Janthinobacterium sp. AD80]|uniref:hypothetical protein n=1 Tax=Janthinobacterium sp. AD80 TaxID=1528773 RepID=UPI000CBC8B8E|nr:hypothetical protein [Janthinobacterium sp. AD80]PMQ08103.1 hypothetical protein JaAD80_27425 [Janthinobacterium sp. AD80]
METAEIVDYAGARKGVSQRVVLTALGGSGATPAAGLTAPVILVKSFEELKARAAEVKGAIVLIDTPFDQEMAERGLAGVTYGQGSRFRFNGPKAAAELGAVAALVRSVGGADFRIPHAGATGLEDGKRIPAAAVTVEDALLIGRLAARGPLKMHLTLTPQNLPTATTSSPTGLARTRPTKWWWSPATSIPGTWRRERTMMAPAWWRPWAWWKP